MSLRIIKRNPAGEDKEVLLEIDPVGSTSGSIQTYSVKGKIIDFRAEGVEGITVRAVHRGVTSSSDVPLGEATSNAEGNYLIYYTTDLLPSGKSFADLVVRAFSSSDELLAQSPIFASALPAETIDLSISTEEFVGLSEFTQVMTAVDPQIQGLTISEITLDGVSIIAGEVGFEVKTVSDYLRAIIRNQNPAYSSISTEVFYGLFRYGLPYEVATLVELPRSRQREALESVTTSNIIDPSLFDNIDAILDALAALRNSTLLFDPVSVDGNSYIAQILGIAGIPETPANQVGERENFVGAYLEYGSEDDFWDLVEAADVFTDDSGSGGLTKAEKRDNVRLAFQIGVISQEYPPLVALVYPTLSQVEEIGFITRSTWLGYINTAGVGVPNVEETELTVLDKDNYADALMTASEKAFPTEVLRTFMSADVSYSSSAVRTFLDSNPDFDIKDTSPRKYFSDNSITDQALMDSIFELKRLWFLASGFDKLVQIKLLIAQGLLSASQITNIGRRTFVKRYSGVFGAEEAERIFKVAAKRSSAAVKLHADFNPSVNNISTPVFADSTLGQTDVDSNPNLEVLFGSQDFCECEYCRSSFSPSAYLIDLLTFLKQTQVYDDQGAITSSNAWDIFSARRPEFQKILLSCDNTNVTFPYIDLVNEVLEHEVLSSSGGVGNLIRQTTLDRETLRVRPEHLSRETYDLLFDGSDESVYPQLLPFHLWNEEAAAYLKLVGINRSEIVEALEGDSLISSGVYLNVSDAMQTVLEDSSAFGKYFGVSSSSSLQPVPALLNRTSVDFSVLNELLETTYFNPDGKAVTFTPSDSCSLEDATLVFESANSNLEYRHLHKFLRLRNILGWSIPELDMVLSGLTVDNVSATVVEKLSGIQKLCKRFKVQAGEVISWYASLSEVSYGGEVSQYDAIYLNPRHNSDPAVRAAFAAGSGISLKDGDQLDTVNSPVVSGALALKSDELLLLVNSELTLSGQPTTDGVVSKVELSHLYRAASFIKALKLSVQEYLDFKFLINPGNQPITNLEAVVDPADTLEFLDKLDTIQQSNFSLDDLRFLFLNEGLRLNKLDDLSLNTLLMGGRSKLQERMSERGVGTDRTREDLLNLFLIFFDEEVAARSIEIVDQVDNTTASIAAANDFIDENWEGIATDTSVLKANLTAAGGSLSDSQERRNVVVEQFLTPLISSLLLSDELVQAVADHFDLVREDVQVLFEDLGTAGLFLNSEFLFSTGDVNALGEYSSMVSTISTIVKTLSSLGKLDAESRHLTFLTAGSTTTQWYNILDFPTSVPATPITNFDSFLSLIKVYELESRYRVSGSFSLIDLVQNGTADYDALSEGTGWSLSDIEYLVVNFPIMSYAQNEGWLVLLDRVFGLITKIGASAEQLNSYSNRDITFEQSQTLQASIKSNFNDATWQEIAVGARDNLRELQRDALTSRLLGSNTSPSFDDVNALYEYFLLDTEIAACAQISRIKLAISSIQLWVQRIRMDLEPGIRFGQEELDEWEWRKNFRVWEAARKVFLYPENLLEPELRDDKSPFFVDLEDELLQDEVTMESAEQAYLNYLNKLDEVAVLEISGIYREEDLNILHVFARTKNSPHFYYYRRQEDGFRWTAWEKVEIDIEGDHLIPVVFNRRPMIFWPIFSEVPRNIPDSELNVTTSNGSITNDVSNKNPVTYAEVKLAYSEFKNNKWQPKKLSKSRIQTTNGFIPSNYFFKILTSDEEGLRIDAFYHEEKSEAFAHVGGFVLNDCTADLEVDATKTTTSPATFSVKNAFRNNMKILEEEGNDQFAITERLKPSRILSLVANQNLSAFERVILNKTPGRFRISYPVSGVDLLSEVPFFFEDKNRVFFVQPSEEVYEREVIEQLPLSILRLRRAENVSTPVEETGDGGSQNIGSGGSGSGSGGPSNGGGGGGGGFFDGDTLLEDIDGGLLGFIAE